MGSINITVLAADKAYSNEQLVEFSLISTRISNYRDFAQYGADIFMFLVSLTRFAPPRNAQSIRRTVGKTSVELRSRVSVGER